MHVFSPDDVDWMRDVDNIMLNRQILLIVNEINEYILDAREEYLKSDEYKKGIKRFDVRIPLQELIDKHITGCVCKRYRGLSFWIAISNYFEEWQYSFENCGILVLHFGGLGYAI